MTETAVMEPTATITVGSTVRIRQGAESNHGDRIPDRLVGQVGTVEGPNDCCGWYVETPQGEAYVSAAGLEVVTEETPEIARDTPTEATSAAADDVAYGTPLQSGDKVRVSVNATDNQGYGSGSVVRGKVGTLDFLDTYSGWYVRPDDGGYGAYVAVQHLTKLSETELLREELNKLTATVATLTEQRDTALKQVSTQASEFEAWKANLQKVAFEAAERNDFCGVFDQVMEEVGLEGREREFEVRVAVELSFWTNVEATSREKAEESIGEDEIRYYLRYNYSNVSIDDYNTGEDY